MEAVTPQKMESHREQGPSEAGSSRSASSLKDLSLPGLRLEKLAGDRAGQYSIRINDQYRICFAWHAGSADDVEITDYH